MKELGIVSVLKYFEDKPKFIIFIFYQLNSDSSLNLNNLSSTLIKTFKLPVEIELNSEIVKQIKSVFEICKEGVQLIGNF